MNLLAVMGSPGRGRATDTLVDKTIEGAIHEEDTSHGNSGCLTD